ncbi:MAG: YkgJ family cysteine cluster protein [Syntrophobacteraceae bacterium]
MSVHNSDSVEKIVERYFSAVAKKPFEFNGKRYGPKPLFVSNQLARGYLCPLNCGACCPVFTLDYLPGEETPMNVYARHFEFNDRLVTVLSDLQLDNKTSHCRNVSREDARCQVHPVRPLSCDFELIRPRACKERNELRVGMFGRAWNLTNAVDGSKGTKCKITAPTEESIADTVRKLNRLRKWTNHFGLGRTWIPEIVGYLQSGRWKSGPVILGANNGTPAKFAETF